MASAETADDGYVLGHSERELERLEAQARFFGDMTRDGLIRAGLRSGMRVLDLGSGVGDVSLIAADIVGDDGDVLGIDISLEAVNTARLRASRLGHGRVRFAQTQIDEFTDFSSFDAVIGRFIIIHLTDPVASIRRVVEKTRRGTIISFAEMDISTAGATPPMSVLDDSVHRIVEVYRRTGKDPDSGTRLHSILRAAGLSPSLFAHTRYGNRDDHAGFGFIQESVRSLLPAMQMLGIAKADEIDVNTLSQRLGREAATVDPAIFYPRFVSAWSATP